MNEIHYRVHMQTWGWGKIPEASSSGGSPTRIVGLRRAIRGLVTVASAPMAPMG